MIYSHRGIRPSWVPFNPLLTLMGGQSCVAGSLAWVERTPDRASAVGLEGVTAIHAHYPRADRAEVFRLIALGESLPLPARSSNVAASCYWRWLSDKPGAPEIVCAVVQPRDPPPGQIGCADGSDAGRRRPTARSCERPELVAPREPELRKAVKQRHDRSVRRAVLGDRKLDAVDLHDPNLSDSPQPEQPLDYRRDLRV